MKKIIRLSMIPLLIGLIFAVDPYVSMVNGYYNDHRVIIAKGGSSHDFYDLTYKMLPPDIANKKMMKVISKVRPYYPVSAIVFNDGYITFGIGETDHNLFPNIGIYTSAYDNKLVVTITCLGEKNWANNRELFMKMWPDTKKFIDTICPIIDSEFK